MDVPFRSGGYEAHGEAWVTFPGTASWGYQEERSHSSGAADTVGIDTGQSQEALRVLHSGALLWEVLRQLAEIWGHLGRQGPEPWGLGSIKNPG